MPGRAELAAIGSYAIWILCLVPIGLLIDFIPKLWRTWKGERLETK